MDKIKVAFRYLPREATNEDKFFQNLLTQNFNIEISPKPEFILFSTFTGKNTREIPIINEQATTIFWTGENIRTNMKKCDYAFGYEYEEEINSPNYVRLPLYAYYGAGEDLTQTKNPEKIMKEKTKFCTYAYSKDAKERVEFFNELSKYKRIDAPGKSMNNSPPIPTQKFPLITKPLNAIESFFGKHYFSSLFSRHFSNWRKDVIAYQKQYKFTIAFENSSYPGYTTEKIYHPMLANSIPIYWGNPEIGREFNTKSFINWYDYNDNKKVVDKVIEIDSNEKKYIKMLQEPYFNDNKPNKWCGKERIVKQFEEIFKVKRVDKK